MLIDIWQRSIRNCLGVNDVSSDTTSAAPLIRRALAASGYIIERGHWIDSAPGGGVYCRRCGVFVKEVKHRRLKISYRDVLFSSVGESELLDKPGYDLNPHRLMHLLATVKDHCREHHLAWDGSISCHHPVGQLHCLFCGKKWPWNNRHNMKQQPCSSGSRQRSNTPDGWLSFRMLDSDRREFIYKLGLPRREPPVRRRLRQKTSVSTSSPYSFAPPAEVSRSSLPSSSGDPVLDLGVFHFDDMG